MGNWENYKNLGGNSKVEKFLIDSQSITIKFKTNKFLYLYNSIKPGIKHIEEMIKFAKLGSGLGGYITRDVKDEYAEKWME